MATQTSAAAAAALQADPATLAQWLAVTPIALPLIGAAVCLVVRSSPALQVRITAVVMALQLLAAIGLFSTVSAAGPVVMTMGNWLPPFGISVVVDLLGAILVLTTALVGLAIFVFSLDDIPVGHRRYGFFSFYLLLIAGVTGAFSTGDIFNLYVWFEVFLIASFGLIVMGGTREQLDGAVKYAVLNLIATTVFLIAVGYLYGVTGTLNMADLSGAVAGLGATAPITTITALFILAFGMKAAAFPLHTWLPASYHTPNVVVSALFGGLLTKVGVYALLRIVVMLMPGAADAFSTVFAWLAALTAFLGVIGALAETNLRRIAGFLVVSGVGLMLIGPALLSQEALTGTVVYAVHSIIVTTALYLAIGVVERIGGSSRIGQPTGLFRTNVLIAGLFLVFAFALAGLPPFSGLWPKILLIEASIAEQAPTLAAVVVVTGLLTTVALGRVWALVILKTPPGETSGAGGPLASSAAAATAVTGVADVRTMGARSWPWVVPLVGLAALTVLLGLFPEPLIRASSETAQRLLEPAAYVDSVLGAGPR